jgi:hypothetical protein
MGVHDGALAGLPEVGRSSPKKTEGGAWGHRLKQQELRQLFPASKHGEEIRQKRCFHPSGLAFSQGRCCLNEFPHRALGGDCRKTYGTLTLSPALPDYHRLVEGTVGNKQCKQICLSL